MLIFLGIFLATLSLLFLEIFSVRIIDVAVGGNTIYYIVSIAMFGMGVAGALGSLTKPIRNAKVAAGKVSWIVLAGSAAIFLLFTGLVIFTDVSGQILDHATAIEASAVEGIIPDAYLFSYMRLAFFGVVSIGALMFLPYLLIGLTLSIVFRAADRDRIPKMYAIDLVGACCGALLGILALDFWDFSSAANFAMAIPLLAGIVFGLAGSERRGFVKGFLVAGVICILGVFVFLAESKMEPKPHLGSMGRVQHHYLGYDVEELWYTWTSFGRIAAIRLTSPDDEFDRTVMVHGSGEGHARVFPYGKAADSRKPKPIKISHAARLTLAACEPEKVLVLMAGAGADMVLIDRMTAGKSEITGIEIAREVFEWPSSRPEYGLDDFFSRPNINMQAAEGREFLARDSNEYDCILRSFGGASRGYYTGVTASAATYLSTREGLGEILSHLGPGGQLTLIGQRTSDMWTIARILREQGRESVRDAFIVASILPLETETEYVLLGEGNVAFMMVKPDGFSDADIANAADVIADAGLHVLYRPDRPAVKDSIIDRLIRSDDPFEIANEYLRPSGASIYMSTDDRPYANDEFPIDAYFTTDFWLGRINPEYSSRIGNVWRHKLRHMLIVLALLGGSFILILAPLIISRRAQAIHRAPGAANHLFYFGCLGAAFMFVEMGLMQKLQLLIGYPAYTIAIVLASLIIFAGIGSFASTMLFGKNILTFRSAALWIVGTATLTLLIVEAAMPVMVGFPRELKLFLAFVFPALPAMLMGQLFPQGLAALASTERLIPLSMGVNAMTSTIAAGLGVALAQIVGYRMIILIGIAIYLLVAVMPHQVREKPR